MDDLAAGPKVPLRRIRVAGLSFFRTNGIVICVGPLAMHKSEFNSSGDRIMIANPGLNTGYLNALHIFPRLKAGRRAAGETLYFRERITPTGVHTPRFNYDGRHSLHEHGLYKVKAAPPSSAFDTCSTLDFLITEWITSATLMRSGLFQLVLCQIGIISKIGLSFLINSHAACIEIGGLRTLMHAWHSALDNIRYSGIIAAGSAARHFDFLGVAGTAGPLQRVQKLNFSIDPITFLGCFLLSHADVASRTSRVTVETQPRPSDSPAPQNMSADRPSKVTRRLTNGDLVRDELKH